MQTVLVTTIERTINTWIHGEFPNPGHWEYVVFPVNSIINFIVIGDDYQPPENTIVMEVDDTAKMGDIVEV